jgi:hypothetical protein
MRGGDSAACYKGSRILRIRGERRDLREDTRGGVATSPEVGSAVEEIPSRNLPSVTYQDLPEALPLRKVLGPRIVANGIGLSPGELIIWPYITSQVGLVFLWAVVIGVLTKFFLNMEIERYTLATGETAITDFSRFWKPWGIVFCLCVIISNAWPGVATSGATVLTFTLGFGNSMIIAMVSLVALAATLTISPVVYRTLEKIEFFKVGAVIVFLNRAFAHYYAIPSDGGFGSSTVYRRMHYPSGGGASPPLCLFLVFNPGRKPQERDSCLDRVAGCYKIPSKQEKGNSTDLSSRTIIIILETRPSDESREKAQVKISLPKVDTSALVFSLKSGPCDLGSLSVLVDHNRASKSNHDRAVLVVAGGLDSDDTDILSRLRLASFEYLTTRVDGVAFENRRGQPDFVPAEIGEDVLGDVRHALSRDQCDRKGGVDQRSPELRLFGVSVVHVNRRTVFKIQKPPPS